MKKNYIAAAFFAGASLAACNSGLDQNNSKNVVGPAPQNTMQLPATPATGTALPQNNNMSAPATGSTVALNPAHGQPGHNCDLAVGAPLNGSAPAQATPLNNPAAPAPAQTNTLPASVLPQPGTPNGSVRLNPAHGQPGHDCAVEVGKPLKQ